MSSRLTALRYGNNNQQHYPELYAIGPDSVNITIDVLVFQYVVDTKDTHPLGIGLSVIVLIWLRSVTRH